MWYYYHCSLFLLLPICPTDKYIFAIERSTYFFFVVYPSYAYRHTYAQKYWHFYSSDVNTTEVPTHLNPNIHKKETLQRMIDTWIHLSCSESLATTESSVFFIVYSSLGSSLGLHVLHNLSASVVIRRICMKEYKNKSIHVNISEDVYVFVKCYWINTALDLMCRT